MTQKFTAILSSIDLPSFEADYYDPRQKAGDVSYRYGLNPWNIAEFAKSLGWPTRWEAGICYLYKSPEHDEVVEFMRAGGTLAGAAAQFRVTKQTIKRVLDGVVTGRENRQCDTGCGYWQYCDTHRNEPVMCEDETEDMQRHEPDGTVYYRSSVTVSRV